MYITKIMQGDKVSELRFMVVYESLPEKRLERLLRKHCLDEAEKFAQLFRLDMNIIRKAKAQVIVDKMICTEQDMDALLVLLDSIGDTLFSLQCCLEVQLSCDRFEDVRRILRYGCSDLPAALVSNFLYQVLLLPFEKTIVYF